MMERNMMEKKLTPAECFEAMKESILSIPENRVIRCTLNNGKAIQEGNRVAELVRRYDAGLRKSGIGPLYLDTIALRAGAYAHCVASEEAYVAKNATRKETFAKLKKEGYALRREMRIIMRYLFRDNSEALKTVDMISSGHNDMEMTVKLPPPEAVACFRGGQSPRQNKKSVVRSNLPSYSTGGASGFIVRNPWKS